jgi:hypothetical protein
LLRLLVPLALAAAIGVAAHSGAAPAAFETTRCGTISVAGTSYAVRIERGRPGCLRARAVLRAFIRSGAAPAGWTCFRGHGAVPFAAACARGRAIVRAYEKR